MFLLGAVPSFFIIRSFRKKEKKQKTRPANPKIITKDVKLDNQEGNSSTTKPNIMLFEYEMIRKSRALQLLESIYSLETTKNLDTLDGRIRFVDEFYDNFIPASKIGFYQGHMADIIDKYKAMYYDRILTENQVSLLLCPHLENIRLFYSDCIVRCYARYVEQQTIEMNKLKTDYGKERRREDMIKKGYSAKYMFKTYKLPDNGHLDSIENIRKQFYSYKKLE